MSSLRASLLVGAIAVATALAACGGEEAPTVDVREMLGVPERFPTPAVPESNPPTLEKLELGRALFSEKRLSANGTQSCVDCHLEEHAFADTLKAPFGSTGQALVRNSQSLLNVAYAPTLTWAADNLTTIEEQLHIPLSNDNPIELGVTDGQRDTVMARFAADSTYADMFAKAFPEIDAPTLDAARFALATFCRSLYDTEPSAYDRYVDGETSALTQQQQFGAELFFGEKYECFHCHTGVMMTVAYADSTRAEPSFFNNGLYDVDGDGSYPATDQGLYDLTLRSRDRGSFRPASLRNVAKTPPYMHDGSLATLRSVVEHYVRGGARSRLQSQLIRPIPDATAEEIDAIVAFLEGL